MVTSHSRMAERGGMADAHATHSTHGGPDAQGVPLHDFSTNANACGPCPQALAAVQQADAVHYPDPAYTRLRQQLATLHGVQPERVLLMTSASEAMSRLSAAARSLGVQRVWWPRQHFGDVARLSLAHGLQSVDDVAQAEWLWCCEPGTPHGQNQPELARWRAGELNPAAVLVLDCAYAPLRLSGQASLDEAAMQTVWQLWSPNKALGLTGVRAAYLVAPRQAVEPSSPPGDAGPAWPPVQLHALLHPRLHARLLALAPSWAVGAHGVAMLTAWCQPDVQQWLADSRQQLADWKARQQALCDELDWAWQPGAANYFLARPGSDWAGQPLWRTQAGIKLRDAESFGLPGWVRLGVRPPASQQALRQAVLAWRSHHHNNKEWNP